MENVVRRSVAQARALVRILEPLILDPAELLEIAELRDSGVSESNIRELYPLPYGKYQPHIYALLNPKRSTWLSQELQFLNPLAQTDYLFRPARQQVLTRLDEGGFTPTLLNSLQADDVKQLNYLLAYVLTIAEYPAEEEARTIDRSGDDATNPAWPISSNWLAVSQVLERMSIYLGNLEKRAKRKNRLRHLLGLKLRVRIS